MGHLLIWLGLWLWWRLGLRLGWAFRIQKDLGFNPWRRSEPFIWETNRCFYVTRPCNWNLNIRAPSPTTLTNKTQWFYVKTSWTDTFTTRKADGLCTNLPCMDINWQSISIYGKFVTSLTAYYLCADIKLKNYYWVTTY